VGFLTQKTSLGSPDIPSRPRLPLEKMPKAINVDAYRDPHRDVHDLPLTLRRPENRLRRRGGTIRLRCTRVSREETKRSHSDA
jgi:hypothetical protein